MAEVAIAVSEAIKYVAISVSVVAVVGLIYAAATATWGLFPIFGAFAAGGLVYQMFKGVNSIMGFGAALATAALVFPVAEGILMKEIQVSPDEIAQGLKGTSMLMAGGMGLGLGYTISGDSMVFAVLGAAAGAFLGEKYLWNPLINFFIDSNIFPKGDYRPCIPSVQRTKAKNWLSNNAGMCAQPGWSSYCDAYSKWMEICPRAARGPEPQPPIFGGAPPAGPDCSAYGSAAGALVPYTYEQYISTGQAQAILGGMGKGCSSYCATHAFTPLPDQATWNWGQGYPAEWPSPIVVVSPGVVQNQSTQDYNLLYTNFFMSADGIPGEPSVLKAGQFYVVSCGCCPDTTSGGYQWCIQPVSAQPTQLPYNSFPTSDIPKGSGSYAGSVAPWIARGGRVCAPAQGAAPNTTGRFDIDIQPVSGDRPQFNIPRRDDNNAQPPWTLARIQANTIDGGGQVYKWETSPGTAWANMLTQPAYPAGVPFPK